MIKWLQVKENSEQTTVLDEALVLLLLNNMWDELIDHDPKKLFSLGERLVNESKQKMYVVNTQKMGVV